MCSPITQSTADRGCALAIFLFSCLGPFRYALLSQVTCSLVPSSPTGTTGTKVPNLPNDFWQTEGLHLSRHCLLGSLGG